MQLTRAYEHLDTSTLYPVALAAGIIKMTDILHNQSNTS